MFAYMLGCYAALGITGLLIGRFIPLPKVEPPKIAPPEPTLQVTFEDTDPAPWLDPVFADLEELFWSPAYGEDLA